MNFKDLKLTPKKRQEIHMALLVLFEEGHDEKEAIDIIQNVCGISLPTSSVREFYSKLAIEQMKKEFNLDDLLLELNAGS